MLDEADELAGLGQATSAILIAGTVLEYFVRSPGAGELPPERHRQIVEWRQLRNQAAHDSAVAFTVPQARQIIDGVRQILTNSGRPGELIHRPGTPASARTVKDRYSHVPTSSGDFIERKRVELSNWKIVDEGGPRRFRHYRFLARGTGADVVERYFGPETYNIYVHSLNLCEVYYDFLRAAGEASAEAAVRDILSLGVQERHDMASAFWRAAGKLKTEHRRVSLADCCALALAANLGAVLVSADRHELEPLADASICPVEFIR